MTPYNKNTMCPIHQIVMKRERMVDGDVNIMSQVPDQLFDYLTLYTPSGQPLARSRGHQPNEDIVLNYRGLNFICTPGYEDAVVVLEWNSLINWANNCYDDDELIVEMINEMAEIDEELEALEAENIYDLTGHLH